MSDLGATADIGRPYGLDGSVAFDLGCVETCAREEGAELLSLLSSPNAVASAIGFQIDEIEMKFLHANSILEFSHSQDPKRTSGRLPESRGHY
jgi:hypothetical protein